MLSALESACQRLNRKLTVERKVLDVRINRLLAWIWSNFSENILFVNFLSGEYGTGVDILSRWGLRDSYCDVEDCDAQVGPKSAVSECASTGSQPDVRACGMVGDPHFHKWEQVHGGMWV